MSKAAQILAACAMSVLSQGVIALGMQETRPAPPATAPAQKLTVTISEVVGSVQVRAGDDQPWQAAKVGMKLDEGAEFRTGLRSRVRFTIPPDQQITLDRLGTVKVLQAIQQSPTSVKTDLGMKYGRTSYDVEEAGVNHEATIRAPGSTLAVRGTRKMVLYDQPGAVPVAFASQPVRFKNVKGQDVNFGTAGATAAATGDQGSAAGTALNGTRLDPAGAFSGRSDAEGPVLTYLQQVAPGLNTNQYALLGLATDPNFKGTVIGTLPIPGQLLISMAFQGQLHTDVDLVITDPRGQVLSPTSTTTTTGGTHFGNGVVGQGGFGSESALYQINYPPGTYTIETQLKSGPQAQTTVGVVKDPLTNGQQVAVFQNTLTTAAPVKRETVNIAAGGSSSPTTSAVTTRRAKR